MVHDGPGAEGDRMAGPHRPDVPLDGLRADEPLVEASALGQDGLAVRQVGRRIGDVRSFDDQLDALELLERTVADLDRAAGDDVVTGEPFPELLEPERVRDRIAVDEGHGLAPSLPDPEVPPGAAGAADDVVVDEFVSLLVSTDDVTSRVGAVGV